MAGQRLLDQGVARRKAIMKYLRTYIAKHGYAPTIQEIADAVQLVSPNATRNHLKRLQEEGLITMQPRISRAIALVDQSKAPRSKRQPVASPEVLLAYEDSEPVAV